MMNTAIKTIKNNCFTAAINLTGAQLWSIQDNTGREYLWQGDPLTWPDKAPVLFPYIARMTDKSYTFQGQKYEMDIHGFAKDSLFQVLEHQENKLTLHLHENAETLKQYPFCFDFYITYILTENTLSVEYRVENRSQYTMYFGIGGHPGFRVPLEDDLSFEDYSVIFHEKCQPKRVAFSQDCFVLEPPFPPFALEEDQKLSLRHDLFDEDAIILENMSREITLYSEKGCRKVTVSYPDMTYLGLWHWPHTEVPYLCIEPWSSLPSRKNVIEALEQQENLISLPAQETYVNCWSITIS